MRFKTESMNLKHMQLGASVIANLITVICRCDRRGVKRYYDFDSGLAGGIRKGIVRFEI